MQAGFRSSRFFTAEAGKICVHEKCGVYVIVYLIPASPTCYAYNDIKLRMSMAASWRPYPAIENVIEMDVLFECLAASNAQYVSIEALRRNDKNIFTRAVKFALLQWFLVFIRNRWPWIPDMVSSFPSKGFNTHLWAFWWLPQHIE